MRPDVGIQACSLPSRLATATPVKPPYVGDNKCIGFYGESLGCAEPHKTLVTAMGAEGTAFCLAPFTMGRPHAF